MEVADSFCADLTERTVNCVCTCKFGIGRVTSMYSSYLYNIFVQGKVYNSCVHHCTLHASETSPVKRRM